LNFKDNTGKSIQAAFEEYHKTNPKVYAAFCRMAFKAIKLDKKKISFKLMGNVIRWHYFIKPRPVDKNQITMPGDTIRNFKLNDAYLSRYARLFIKEFPDFAPYIEMRELRA